MLDWNAWLEMFGRLHVVLVHFPIALLVVAALAGSWRALCFRAGAAGPQRGETAGGVFIICLSLGAVAAIAAAASGLVHERHESIAGGSRAHTLLWHKGFGIATAVIAIAATVLVAINRVSGRAHNSSRSGDGPGQRQLTRAAAGSRVLALCTALTAAVTVGVTGHFGGMLTHGEGYLTESRDQPAPPRGASNDAKPAAERPPTDHLSSPVGRIDFARDIQPLLATHCHECHGPTRRRGRLRVDSHAALLRGGNSGPAIVPCRSDESTLIRRVLGLDDEKRMPLDAEPLSDEQIAMLRAWIDQGAEASESAESAERAADDRHWAYVPPARPATPAIGNAAWCRNEIDAFILARLERESMTPSPEADRTTLLRRVYLDLIGLPPTIEQADAFLADDRPDAYERLVDELLDSPHFGERWARPWLDLARYADSNGYEKDLLRTMWPYRDWVINALNRDMPFDQFTIEQVAGDLLPEPTLEQRIATGFHRNTLMNEEGGVDPEEARNHVVVDRVNTTATVWLGSTIACAQCHNHKFDPFSQKEYYRLFAFFNNTAEETFRRPDNNVYENSPKLRLPVPDEAAIRARIADVERLLSTPTPELTEAQTAWEQSISGPVRWTELAPERFESAGGATISGLRDGSILVGGLNPETDTYTIELRTTLPRITAIRLDVLTHASLGRDGPGRPSHGNFVLTEFRAAIATPVSAASGVPIQFATPAADHEQTRNGEDYRIARAIDGDHSTGWAIAPNEGVPHYAIFVPASPIDTADGARLSIELEQNYGYQHTIGRIRLSVTDDPGDPRRDALPEAVRGILAIDPPRRTGPQRDELAAYYRSIAPSLRPLREELVRKQRSLENAPTTLVMQELPQPRQTHVLLRGDFLSPGEPVEPDVPAVLPPLPADAVRNRLTLARWLVDPANPLTARVTMNRVWEQYFGRGIVATSEDFGVQGDPPTHPDLLDWLATELVARGWRLKPLHRLIVTSATYRQSSIVTPQALERDPYNRLLARGPRFRMEAELLRDQALAVAGLLSPKIGGPSVMPFQPEGIWASPSSADNDKWIISTGDDRYRRGLYTFWRRSSPYPSFVAFDAPNRELACTRRPRTNTPLQALTTLNDPEFVAPAVALARRIVREGGSHPADCASYAVRSVLTRLPRSDEINRLVALYEQQLRGFRADPRAAAMLSAGALGPPPADMDVSELAAWSVVANILLNLDETLTRG